MTYEVHLDDLKSKQTALNSQKGSYDGLSTELEGFDGSEIAAIVSATKTNLSKLEEGYPQICDWLDDYLSELDNVESGLTSHAEIADFTGAFENIFAAYVAPTIKEGATQEEKQIQVSVHVETVSGKDNEEIIYNYFANLGFNDAAICAILANVEAESGFKSDIDGDDGTSYGICQWHDSRWYDLQNYCDSRGLDWKSIDGQLEFLQYELENKYTGVYNTLKNVPNTSQGSYDAAYIWTTDFEIPKYKETQGQVRGSRASGTYWENYSSQSLSKNKSSNSN